MGSNSVQIDICKIDSFSTNLQACRFRIYKLVDLVEELVFHARLCVRREGLIGGSRSPNNLLPGPRRPQQGWGYFQSVCVSTFFTFSFLPFVFRPRTHTGLRYLHSFVVILGRLTYLSWVLIIKQLWTSFVLLFVTCSNCVKGSILKINVRGLYVSEIIANWAVRFKVFLK